MIKHKLDIQLSATAREDFVAILRYTLDSWGEAQMLRYRDQLNSMISSLVENPELGRLRPELEKQYRSIAAGSHLIVYAANSETLNIVRILHSRMDPTKQLSD